METAVNNPFDKLKDLRDALPPGPEPKKPEPPPDPMAKALKGKITVRHERKGRGGRTVTVVSGIGLPDVHLEALCREMKKGMGCGATVEDGAVILQGEIMDRALEWLTKRGATRLVRGSV